MTLDAFRIALLHCRTLDECAVFVRDSFDQISRLFYDASHIETQKYILQQKRTFDAFMSAPPMTAVRRGHEQCPDAVLGLLLFFASYFERAGMYAEIVDVQQLPGIPKSIKSTLKAIHLLRDIRNPAHEYVNRFEKVVTALSEAVDQNTAVAIVAEFYARGFTQIQPLNPDSAIAFKSRFVDPTTQRQCPVLKARPLLRLYALTLDELAAEVPRLNMRAVECMYDAACCYIDPLPPAGALRDATVPPSTICAHTQLDHGGHCPPGLHAAKVAIADQYPTEYARTNTYVGQELNSKVYVSFDSTVECMRYFRQYMPLHMPQIEEAVVSTLQQSHFSQRRVHILDIGGGPGNLYCILAGLLHRALIPDLHFEISLVEPGSPFHGFLDVISHHVHHPRLRLRTKYACRLDQLPDRMQTKDVDWFFVANAITPLVANAGNVPAAVDSFCHVIDATRRKHSTGTLTIAENTRSTDFPAFAENLRGRGLVPQISDRSCNAPWLGGCQFYVTGPRRLTSPRLKLSVVPLMEGATA